MPVSLVLRIARRVGVPDHSHETVVPVLADVSLDVLVRAGDLPLGEQAARHIDGHRVGLQIARDSLRDSQRPGVSDFGLDDLPDDPLILILRVNRPELPDFLCETS